MGPQQVPATSTAGPFAFCEIMPIYILKQYRRVLPSAESIWHLGREVAFHATSVEKAIMFAQKYDGSDFAPHGWLAILFDPRGRRLWETIFEQVGLTPGRWSPIGPPTAAKNVAQFANFAVAGNES